MRASMLIAGLVGALGFTLAMLVGGGSGEQPLPGPGAPPAESAESDEGSDVPRRSEVAKPEPFASKGPGPAVAEEPHLDSLDSIMASVRACRPPAEAPAEVRSAVCRRLIAALPGIGDCELALLQQWVTPADVIGCGARTQAELGRVLSLDSLLGLLEDWPGKEPLAELVQLMPLTGLDESSASEAIRALVASGRSDGVPAALSVLEGIAVDRSGAERLSDVVSGALAAQNWSTQHVGALTSAVRRGKNPATLAAATQALHFYHQIGKQRGGSDEVNAIPELLQEAAELRWHLFIQSDEPDTVATQLLRIALQPSEDVFPHRSLPIWIARMDELLGSTSPAAQRLALDFSRSWLRTVDDVETRAAHARALEGMAISTTDDGNRFNALKHISWFDPDWRQTLERVGSALGRNDVNDRIRQIEARRAR